MCAGRRFSFVSDSGASAPGLTDEMKNDIGSYMKRKIGTSRVGAFVPDGEAVQGSVPSCLYRELQEDYDRDRQDRRVCAWR